MSPTTFEAYDLFKTLFCFVEHVKNSHSQNSVLFAQDGYPTSCDVVNNVVYVLTNFVVEVSNTKD